VKERKSIYNSINDQKRGKYWQERKENWNCGRSNEEEKKEKPFYYVM
jgi:hypothetical protein